MKTHRIARWVSLLTLPLVLGCVPALADDSFHENKLTQTSFDHLIPASFPTTRPDFDRLHQTSFAHLIPSSYPTIRPDFARIDQVNFDQVIVTSLASKSRPSAISAK